MRKFNSLSVAAGAAAIFFAALIGAPATAKIAVDGMEKVSKKEIYSASDTDAFVVFRFSESIRYAGLPDFGWAKVDTENHIITPYEKKSLNKLDIGRALTTGSVISFKSGKPKYYAFRIPAGPHLLCEFFLTRADTLRLIPHTANFAAPYFEFQPGTVNYIGSLNVDTKSIVSYSDNASGSVTISMEETGIPYLSIGAGGDVEGVTSYIEDRFDGVIADVVVLTPVHLDLHKPDDGPLGYSEVKNPGLIERNSEEFSTLSGKPPEERTGCLPPQN